MANIWRTGFLQTRKQILQLDFGPSIDKSSGTAVSEFLAVLVVIDVYHLVPLGRAWICVIMRE
jgi:hypothetical protein